MHVFAAIALTLAVAVPQGDPPPKEKVTADIITVNGNGCTPGTTTSVSVAPDNSAFVLTGNGLVHAAAGADATPGQARRSCQITMRLTTPPGYTYALGKAEYQGLAEIHTGAVASFRATYSFQGLGTIRDRVFPFRGPLFDGWDRMDSAEPIVHLPCGEKRNLTLFHELRASKGTSDPTTTSYLYRDTSATLFELHWKRCPAA